MTTTGAEPLGEHSVSLAIRGMTCGSCAAKIERHLNGVDGVRARVNYASERADVRLASGVPPERLLREVSAIGFEADVVLDSSAELIASADESRVRYYGRRLFVALVLIVPLSDLSIGFWVLPSIRFPGWQWAMLALAAPVICWAAWPFYLAALRAARHRTSTMDTLVSIGIVSSTAWSVFAMFYKDVGHGERSLLWILSHGSSGGIYLEVGAGVTTFLLAGRYFEARTRRRAGDALRSLAHLGAQEVSVVQADGSERRLPISMLEVGDCFVVRPGEAVATEGRIEEGESALDCSAMTGESIPRDVRAGDAVVGGTVSLGGRLVVRATKVGQDTQLAHMLRLVEQAQNEKAAAQRLADRISVIFVPGVLVIASATLVAWLVGGHSAGRSVSVALSVLIIACPCALGLATPAALLVASGEAARRGIFFKGHRSLERFRHIDTVVFDKTGTLTEGKMQVTDVRPAPGISEGQLLTWAGALEQASEHPVAQAISAFASARVGPMPRVREFVSVTGSGVQGKVGGHRIAVGQPGRLVLHEFEAPDATRWCAEIEAQGRTPIVVWRDGSFVGVFGVADTLRPSAAVAVAKLQALGLRCVLASGDTESVAHSIARLLGIEEVRAGALPSDKVQLVGELRSMRRTVAFVGDGVNDSPALAAADLGVAIGSGTDIAINAADVVVLRDDLRVVATAVTVARRTLRTIRGNLAWAFGYNLVAIPLAALGYLDPLIAGAAMALSSGLVLLNSSAIRRCLPRDLEEGSNPLLRQAAPEMPLATAKASCCSQ